MVSPKFRGGGGVVKLPSVECVSISLKLRGVFCKIDIHKVQGPFSCKIVIHRLQVDTKFEGFLVKFISQLFLTVGLVVEEF